MLKDLTKNPKTLLASVEITCRNFIKKQTTIIRSSNNVSNYSASLFTVILSLFTRKRVVLGGPRFLSAKLYSSKK